MIYSSHNVERGHGKVVTLSSKTHFFSLASCVGPQELSIPLCVDRSTEEVQSNLINYRVMKKLSLKIWSRPIMSISIHYEREWCLARKNFGGEPRLGLLAEQCVPH